MDLEKFDVVKGANDGFELELLSPKDNSTPLGIFITIMGTDSDEFRKIRSAQNRQRVAKLSKGNRTIVSADEIDAAAIELLVACTKSWRDGTKITITLRGEELPCIPMNVEKLFKAMPWIREQVDVAINDRANFIKG